MDNPFWVGPHPEPIISLPIHTSPLITAAPIKIPTTKIRPRPRPRPSLDPSPNNPFLNSDNPFIGMDVDELGAGNGSGRGSLFKTFKALSKSRSQSISVSTSKPRPSSSSGAGSSGIQAKKVVRKSTSSEEENLTYPIRHIDLKPTTEQLLAAQERIGGSSVAPSEFEENIALNPGGKRKDHVDQDPEQDQEVKPKVKRVKGRKSEPAPKMERRVTRARASLAVKYKDEEEEDEDEIRINQAVLDASANARAGGKAGAGVVVKEREVQVEVKVEQEDRVEIPTSTTGAGPSRLGGEASTVKLEQVPNRVLGDLTNIATGAAGAGPSNQTANCLDTENDAGADTKTNTLEGTNSKEKGKAAAKGKGKGKGKEVVPAGEVRTGRWRKKCPKSTLERLDRVMHQRMFMLDRSRLQGGLMEVFKVLGSTGNVYTIKIDRNPTCDCPDAGKGNIPCKHIIFIFIKVLKVPPSSELWYQKNLLESELQVVFEYAPPSARGAYQIPNKAREAYMKAINPHASVEEEVKEGEVEDGVNPKRKEAIGEDCPVCYEEMSEEDVKGGQLVWDESDEGCGKALHVECFRNWTMSLASKGTEITCVWCRCAWPSAGAAGGKAAGSGGVQYTSTGYMNIADLAGVSRVRDTSTYYHGPMRGRRMDEVRYQDD